MASLDWWVTTPAIFSRDECYDIAKIDAHVVSSRPDRYAAQNAEAYYLALNSYLFLLTDLGLGGFRVFAETYLAQHGMLKFIEQCDKYATELIRNDVWWLTKPTGLSGDFRAFTSAALQEAPARDQLIALRVLKRFSGDCVDLLQEDSVQSFRDVEQVNRRLDHLEGEESYFTRNYDSLISTDVCRIEARHLFLDQRMMELRDVSRVHSEHSKAIPLPPGAASDACNCYRCKRIALDEYGLLEKFEKVCANPRNSVAPRISVPNGSGGRKVVPVLNWDKEGYSVYGVRIMAVPKSYKAARLIAPEPVLYNSLALDNFKAHLDDIEQNGKRTPLRERYLHKYGCHISAHVGPKTDTTNEESFFAYRWVGEKNSFSPWLVLQHEVMWLNAPDDDIHHGQHRNRLMAKIGSITGTIATIDQSHASDSNRKSVVKRTMHSAERLLCLAPRYWVDPSTGIKRRLSMAATSGFAETFFMESSVFTKAVYVATELAWEWLEPSELLIPDFNSCDFDTDEVELREPKSLWDLVKNTVAVFGDDITCHARVVPTLIDVLESYGFSVNRDKSFWIGFYRESCGHEYYRGTRVDHMYWPRKGMSLESSQVSPDWSAGTTDDVSRLIAYSNRLASELGCDSKAHTFLLAYIREKLGYKMSSTTRVMSVMPPEYAPGDRIVHGDPVVVLYRVGRKIVKSYGILSTRPRDLSGKTVLPSPDMDSWRDLIAESGETNVTDVKLLGIGVKNKKVPCSTKRTCLCNHIDIDSFVSMDAYNQYLEYGPLYETPLDRLLGVTTSRLSKYGYESVEASVDTVQL